MKQKDTLKAITSAITYLEDSMEALTKKDEKRSIHFTWRAASELEYSLFLLSLAHQNENEGPSCKFNPGQKKVEIGQLIISAQNLLKEAKNNLEADKLHEAHKKTWIARGQLIRLHNFYEKKRRKGEKTSFS